jgi:hypothetical protein
LEFIRADPTEDLGALIFAGKFDAPRQLPPTQFGKATRFGAVFARNRRFFLRWTNQVGKRFFLEILDKSESHPREPSASQKAAQKSGNYNR